MKFKPKFDQKGRTFAQYLGRAVSQDAQLYRFDGSVEPQDELWKLYNDLLDDSYEPTSDEFIGRFDAHTADLSREAEKLYISIVKAYKGK